MASPEESSGATKLPSEDAPEVDVKEEIFGATVLTEPQPGPTMQVLDTVRIVKAYSIQESELEQISSINSQTTRNYALASAIAAFIFGVGIDIVREYDSKVGFGPVDTVLLYFGLPISIVLALFFAHQGWRL